MRRAAALLALALAACAERKPVEERGRAAEAESPADDAARQIADGLAARPDDPAAMARFGGRRDGAVLTLTVAGRVLRFVDSGLCEGFDTCRRHRLDAPLGAHFAGVVFDHGESPGSYFVYDRRSATPPVDTETRPLLSPSERLALVGAGESLNAPEFPGVAVIALPTGRVLFRDDAHAATVARWVGWRGEDCAAFVNAGGATRHVARAGKRWRIADGACPA